MKRPVDQARIFVLTGAGISVASGIRPFRGRDGLWNEAEAVRLSHIDTLYRDPAAVWKLFGGMRGDVLAASPNAAHNALAQVESNLKPDQQFLLVTQNIDGLHQRAGSRNVVEYHGSLLHTRCRNCSLPAFVDNDTHQDAVPVCPQCGNPLRPDIVFFGEQISLSARQSVNKLLGHCDIFIAIGTSGTVMPAAGFVKKAYYAGATTVYVNTEPLSQDTRHFFRRQFIGAAELLLPNVLDFLLGG